MLDIVFCLNAQLHTCSYRLYGLFVLKPVALRAVVTGGFGGSAPPNFVETRKILEYIIKTKISPLKMYVPPPKKKQTWLRAWLPCVKPSLTLHTSHCDAWRCGLTSHPEQCLPVTWF